MDKDPPMHPIVYRKTAQLFTEWCFVVLDGGKKYVHPRTLQNFYDQGWDAAAVIEVFLDLHFYTIPLPQEESKYKKAAYEVDFVNARLAAALWKECGRLIAKNLTPEARKIVLDAKAMAERTLLPARD